MIMAARWRRAVEYWPPFAILFAAFSLQPILSGARNAVANRLPTNVLDDLQPFLDRHEQPEAIEKINAKHGRKARPPSSASF
jgi:hypothetical protein